MFFIHKYVLLGFSEHSDLNTIIAINNDAISQFIK